MSACYKKYGTQVNWRQKSQRLKEFQILNTWLKGHQPDINCTYKFKADKYREQGNLRQDGLHKLHDIYTHEILTF